MAYEKKTGFVALEKLEDASELTAIQGGTKVPMPNLKLSYCIVHTHTYKRCWEPGVPPQE